MIDSICSLLSLSELLSRLLTSAFEGYDLENMITAFLLARQGALEGAAIFPSYSDWFKVSYQLVNNHLLMNNGPMFLFEEKKDLIFGLWKHSDSALHKPSGVLSSKPTSILQILNVLVTNIQFHY